MEVTEEEARQITKKIEVRLLQLGMTLEQLAQKCNLNPAYLEAQLQLWKDKSPPRKKVKLCLKRQALVQVEDSECLVCKSRFQGYPINAEG